MSAFRGRERRGAGPAGGAGARPRFAPQRPGLDPAAAEIRCQTPAAGAAGSSLAALEAGAQPARGGRRCRGLSREPLAATAPGGGGRGGRGHGAMD